MAGRLLVLVLHSARMASCRNVTSKIVQEGKLHMKTLQHTEVEVTATKLYGHCFPGRTLKYW